MPKSGLSESPPWVRSGGNGNHRTDARKDHSLSAENTTPNHALSAWSRPLFGPNPGRFAPHGVANDFQFNRRSGAGSSSLQPEAKALPSSLGIAKNVLVCSLKSAEISAPAEISLKTSSAMRKLVS